MPINRSFISNLFVVFLLTTRGLFAQFAGGTGTESDPYQISTPEHLNSLRNYLGYDNVLKYFKLINDIDLTVYLAEGGAGYLVWGTAGWLPIGDDENYFGGRLDGSNHIISGLKIDRPNRDWVGLFGYLTSANLKNLSVIVPVGQTVRGQNNVGGLVGEANLSILTNICITGKIVGTGGSVGGLAGSIGTYAVINNCHSCGEINGGNQDSGGIYIGGLCGFSQSEITNSSSCSNVVGNRKAGGLVGCNSNIITNCYATGIITTTGLTNSGGLVGENFGDIDNSFATGAVTCPRYAGGLVGLNSNGAKIVSCYAIGHVESTEQGTAGGITGGNFFESTVIDSYWDRQTTGTTTSYGSDDSFGRTSAEMKTQSTYIGWDFPTVWSFNSNTNNGYPYLTNTPCVGISFPTIPTHKTILSNYPNPFNPTTTICYELTKTNFTNISIYNSKGELIKVLINALQPAGKYSIDFNGSQLNSGVYYCVLEVEGKREFNKMIIIK